MCALWRKYHIHIVKYHKPYTNNLNPFMDKFGILLSISPFKLFFPAQFLCVDIDTSYLYLYTEKDHFCG